MENLLAPRITNTGNLVFPAQPKTEIPNPWIGDLFGVPQPSFLPEPDNKTIYRYEMEVLYKDFATRTYIMEGKDPNPFESQMCIGLQHVAYTDTNVLAFSLKTSYKDKETGRFKRDKTFDSAAYRISPTCWQWLKSKRTFEVSNPYR